MLRHCLLPDRGHLRLGGAEAVPFLQNLVSNDVARAGPDRAVYATLLTPQGRFLFDFLVAGEGEALLLDAEAPRLADLQKRLTLYRLRSKVTIEKKDWVTGTLWGEGAAAALGLGGEAGSARAVEDAIVFVDPRLAALGLRVIGPEASVARLLSTAGEASDFAAWDRHRLDLGVPDGSRDVPVEKGLLLEHNFEELNAIDFKKGCYIGQELTARTKYRGLVKKRLYKVTADGALPAPGTLVMRGEHEAGTMCSSADGAGLALLRLEDVATGEPLKAGEAVLHPVKPDWASF